MRGFIVLCLCAITLAAPQGYKYSQGGGSIAVQQPSSVGGYGNNFSGSAPSAIGGNFYQGNQNLQHSNFVGHQHVQHHTQQPQQVIISKRFFIHSAPEDVDDDYKEKHITVGVPKKNYNVVFIKSPSKSTRKAAIKISPAPNEEKTVIYVLSQKSDTADIQAEVIEHPTTTAKPEVFFIKYKTKEEAHHAQEQIQAQYDALGGSSQVTDEGTAPVTSVIGALSSDDVTGSHVGSSAQPSAGSVSLASAQTGTSHNNAYLPPNFY